jgi:hypothetical protein
VFFENENAAATPRFCLCRGTQANRPLLRADFTSDQHSAMSG